MNVNKVEPYSDELLKWDEVNKRYELAFEYVKANFDTNFRDDKVLKRRITKNSRVVYNFIYYRSNTKNRVVVEWLLNKTKEGREFLLQALSSQFEADVESGYNDLGDVAPINVANGNIIDRNQIIANQVSTNTEQIIDDNSRYFGINIVYQAQFPWIYFKVATEK